MDRIRSVEALDERVPSRPVESRTRWRQEPTPDARRKAAPHDHDHPPPPDARRHRRGQDRLPLVGHACRRLPEERYRSLRGRGRPDRDRVVGHRGVALRRVTAAV
ncbi:hypothetical protein ABZT04_09480 [Streptomyces sp. NPDC005492]|uniref:hypothetical protein n=1 Tax=Streptomyces sp. NPDC005492 TaxID=3156883 RepID=UPI0033A0D799